MLRNQKKKSDGQKKLTITIRASANSMKGELIEYLQSDFFEADSIVEDMLVARFLPFLLDSKKNKERDRDRVKQCLGTLSGYENAIALKWGINLAAIQGVKAVDAGSQGIVDIDVDVEDSNGNVKLDPEPEQAEIHKKCLDDLGSA
jgi:copper chaperone CopZ